MATLLTAALSLLLHVVLGWAWTIFAGVFAGYMTGRGGWYRGLLGVGWGWLVPIVYGYATAPYETMTMTGVFGGLMGGVPGPLVAVLTLAIGVVLGALGGLIGTRLGLLKSRYQLQRRLPDRPQAVAMRAGEAPDASPP